MLCVKKIKSKIVDNKKKKKNESVKSKQSQEHTQMTYLSIPIHRYFHNDMAVWNEESEDQLINMIYIQNALFTVCISTVLFSVSSFE